MTQMETKEQKKPAAARDKAMMAQVTENPQLLAEMMQTLDSIAVYCFLEPKCHNIPEEGDKDPELLYVDEVELDDKMFLFQAATGGTKDLERFRAEQGGRVEGVQPRPNKPRPTKRTGGARKR